MYTYKTSEMTFVGNKPRPSNASSSRIETEEGMRNAFEKDWGGGGGAAWYGPARTRGSFVISLKTIAGHPAADVGSPLSLVSKPVYSGP